MPVLEKIKFSQLTHFTPKQDEANEAIKKYKFILYGGAMGGGKSYWLRWELVKLVLYYYQKHKSRNVMVGLFCEDYPALQDRHLNKIRFEFPDWLGQYNAQFHNFTFYPEFGGGIIAFRNLDDVSKYQSAEFAAIAVDELTKNPKETFDFLRTRLRWPGIENVKFIAGTNPGGIGHNWVKKIWLDKEFDENEQEKELFCFIQAKAEDNPYLDPSYFKSLESLPEALRKAYLEGDWDIFKGQYFTEWRRDIHTIEPFILQEDWKRIITIDYGYSKPSAVYWLAIDPSGAIYVYRELYETQLTYTALARKILNMTEAKEKIDYWVADPSIWAKKGDEFAGNELIEQEYYNITGKRLRLIQGNNDRINGWRVVREYLKPFLKDNKLEARLKVFFICDNLIKTFPSLVYDPIKAEDLDTDGEDHAADAIRYGIMTKPDPALTTEQIREINFKKRMKKADKNRQMFKMTNY